MIDVINEFVKLKSEAFLIKKNKEEIFELYESILLHHPKKDDFKAKSEEFINLLISDKLSEEKYREWISFTMNHFGMHIAMRIYDNNKRQGLSGDRDRYR